LQLKEFASCLRPALYGQKPAHAWLYGRPGTGKTLVAKFVLRDLGRDGRLGGIYINYWENNSYYSVLDRLVRELRILSAEKLNTAFKLERFRLFVGTRPFVVAVVPPQAPLRPGQTGVWARSIPASPRRHIWPNPSALTVRPSP
jgi:Cdc6-like AAA superfamily ATPase